jgi:hypothetical protein
MPGEVKMRCHLQTMLLKDLSGTRIHLLRENEDDVSKKDFDYSDSDLVNKDCVIIIVMIIVFVSI